jgi:putative heme-binding domain-containing protein
MGRGVPCDLAFYDEPMFPELRGNLLLCRWDRFAVTRFPLQPRGATYSAPEVTFLVGSHNARPTGITTDRAGRVYVTSLYLEGNAVSPHCVSDLMVLTREGAEPVEPCDETTASVDRLWADLSGPSGEARRRSHTELLRRGGEALAEAVWRLEEAADDDPALVHLPWLAAAAGGPEAAELLVRLARSHPRAEVRLQAVRALTDCPALKPPRQLFVDALDDPADPVKLAALAWFFEAAEPPPLEPVVRLAAGADPYLRQTATTLLARRADLADIERLARAEDSSARLAAVLAAGTRLTVPEVHQPPPQGVPLFYPEGNMFFQRKMRYADSPHPVDLADLGPVGSYTTAQQWEAYRLAHKEDYCASPPVGVSGVFRTEAGRTASAETRLFDLLCRAQEDSSVPVQSQAAFYLGLLCDPRTEPAVAQVTRELRGRGLAEQEPTSVRVAWVAGPFPGRGPVENSPQQGPIDLAAEYPAGAATVRWRKVEAAENRLSWSAAGDTSTFVYVRLQSRSPQPALLTVTTETILGIRHNGRQVGTTWDGITFMLDLQPGSNDVLVRVAGAGPVSLAVRARERVTAEAPEREDGALLAERLKAGGAAVDPEFLKIDWQKEARSGDPERGRKLFGSLGCARCHAITPDQAGGGAPSLTDVGKRFTPAYLVESILTPDKQVADEFRATTLVTKRGQLLSGLVVRETATELELLLPDTSHRVVPIADVEERKLSATSPMPSGLIKTPDELRDLLTYLLSDHPLPP